VFRDVLVANLGNITLANNLIRHERDGDALDQMMLGIKQMRLESGVMSEHAFTPRETDEEQARPDIEYSFLACSAAQCWSP
jgi:hypothetical protein